MKISVYNFKSIKELEDFEIKPLTIIAGTNNSGKSSLFQFLLLLKQTLEMSSTETPLSGKGLADLVFDRNSVNEMGASFEVLIDEFPDRDAFENFAIPKGSKDAKCRLDVSFRFTGDVPIVSNFKILLDDPSFPPDNLPFLRVFRSSTNYAVESNVTHFGSSDLRWLPGEARKLQEIGFGAMFPLNYRLSSPAEDEEESGSFTLPPVHEFLRTFFSNLSYIEPVREPPKHSYIISRPQNSIGNSGEYSAQILHAKAEEPVQFYKFYAGNADPFQKADAFLLDAVNYWICEKFGIGKKIYAEKKGDVYQIFLENERNLKTPLNQVGFGVSQILPIVIEGVLMTNNGVLMVEEPESHLHPKLQGELFDFLYSLVLQGKTVILETHSDHLITRMQRRVAEDLSNVMAEQINLNFISSVDGIAEFQKVALDKFGIVDYFPEDFIELSNRELSAIVEAQMEKRKREAPDE